MNDSYGVWQTNANNIDSSLGTIVSAINTAINADGVDTIVSNVSSKWESPRAVEFFNNGTPEGVVDQCTFALGLKKELDNASSTFVTYMKNNLTTINNSCELSAKKHGASFDGIDTSVITIDQVNVTNIKSCRDGVANDVHMDPGTGASIAATLGTMKSTIDTKITELTTLFDENKILTGTGDWDKVMTCISSYGTALETIINRFVAYSESATSAYETKVAEGTVQMGGDGEE